MQIPYELKFVFTKFVYQFCLCVVHVTGNCGIDALPSWTSQITYLSALNNAQYASGASCGMCVEGTWDGALCTHMYLSLELVSCSRKLCSCPIERFPFVDTFVHNNQGLQ